MDGWDCWMDWTFPTADAAILSEACSRRTCPVHFTATTAAVCYRRRRNESDGDRKQMGNEGLGCWEGMVRLRHSHLQHHIIYLWWRWRIKIRSIFPYSFLTQRKTLSIRNSHSQSLAGHRARIMFSVRSPESTSNKSPPTITVTFLPLLAHTHIKIEAADSFVPLNINENERAIMRSCVAVQKIRIWTRKFENSYNKSGNIYLQKLYVLLLASQIV